VLDGEEDRNVSVVIPYQVVSLIAENKNKITRLGRIETYKISQKRAQKQPPKSGLGDRQVGAFSVFRLRDTGIPFIFWPFWLFFQKNGRLRGWCNTGPGIPVFYHPKSMSLLTYCLPVAYSQPNSIIVFIYVPYVWARLKLLLYTVSVWDGLLRYNSYYQTSPLTYFYTCLHCCVTCVMWIESEWVGVMAYNTDRDWLVILLF